MSTGKSEELKGEQNVLKEVKAKVTSDWRTFPCLSANKMYFFVYLLKVHTSVGLSGDVKVSGLHFGKHCEKLGKRIVQVPWDILLISRVTVFILRETETCEEGKKGIGRRRKKM